MNKSLKVRVAGLALAVIAFPPALFALLKNFRFPFTGFQFRGPFWDWIASWMPPIRYDLEPISVLWSLPGFVAASLVGLGIGIAVFSIKRRAVMDWEDDGT